MHVGAPFGSPLALGATARVETDGSVRYRRVFALAFARDALADGLVFDEAQTRFKATASSQRVNILTADPGVEAQISSLDGNTLAVHLERPYAVDRVVPRAIARRKEKGRELIATRSAPRKAKARAAGAAGDALAVSESEALASEQLSSPSGLRVELYRLDGDALAESATVDAPAGSSIAGFVAKDFAVRVRASDGDLVALNPSYFSAIDLRSFPTGLRFGLCPSPSPSPNPAELSAFEPDELFFHAAGELAEINAEHALNQDSGEDFHAALKRFAAAHFSAGSSDPFAVHLLVEADTPCTVTLAEFGFDYRLATRSTLRDPAGAVLDRQVLRFAGQQRQAQALTLVTPAAPTTVHRATLALEASFGDAPFGYLQGGAAAASEQHRHGFALQDSSFAAYRLDLAQGRAADGLMLYVLNLSARTELSIALREDHGGTPSGATLAEGTVESSAAGQRSWLRLSFPTPLALLARPYWILARTLRGRALWLIDAAPDASIISVPVTGQQAAMPETAARVDGVRPRAVLYSRTLDAAAGEAPLSLQLGPAHVALTRVVSTTSEDAEPAKTSRWQADLLSLGSAALGADGSLQVSLASPLAGIATVYALELEYELSEPG
jgi:hypothetical protein